MTGSEASGLQVMHFLPPTSSVAEEQEEGHASRCHLRNQCFADLRMLWQHLEEVAVEPLRPSLASLH